MAARRLANHLRQAFNWQRVVTSDDLAVLSAEVQRVPASDLPDPPLWYRYQPTRRLKSGYYMLEAMVTRARIGHDLVLRTDNGEEFHLLLGAKAVSKRIVYLDSSTTCLDLALRPRRALEPGSILTLTRLSHGFAKTRMVKKLEYATGAVSADGSGKSTRGKSATKSDIRTLPVGSLYQRYQSLMEKHARPLSYKAWTESRTSAKHHPPANVDIGAMLGRSLSIVFLSRKIDWSGLVAAVSALPAALQKSLAIYCNCQSIPIEKYPLLAEIKLVNGAGLWDANDWQSAYAAANHDYRLFVAGNVRLTSDSLVSLLQACNESGASLVYADHEEIDARGLGVNGTFKPQWNPELLLSGNYIGPMVLFRQSFLDEMETPRWLLGESLLYDLLLEATMLLKADQVKRVAGTLYRYQIPDETGATHGFYRFAKDVVALQWFLNRHSMPGRIVEGKSPLPWAVEWQLPEEPPLVDILIPTRNGRVILESCIESVLHRTDYPRYGITILDNDSDEEDTLAYLETIARHEKVQVIKCPGEFNYSAINNRGVAETQGDIVLLLNNDTEVFRSDWLHHLVVQASRPETGCVGAKLYYSNGLVQHAGVIVGLKGVAGHAHRFSTREAPGYCGRLQAAQEMSAVTAACLAVRRSVFEAVGGLDDTHLKVAYNDVDFCLRVREAGYRNIWTPWAEMYHHESVSRGSDDSGSKAKRFRSEYVYMLERWNTANWQDPAYNPNLSHDAEDFSLAA